MLTIPTLPSQDTIGIYSGGFNSPSAEFSPLSLSPALWLSDTGSDPSVWTDISGNGRDASQSDPIRRPAIITGEVNGRQVRRFDGANDLMSVTSGLGMLRNVPGATIIAAYRWIVVPNDVKVIFVCTTGSSTSAARAAIAGGVPSQRYFAGGRRLDGDGFISTNSTISITTSYSIHAAVLDYANSDLFLYINGATEGINNTFQTNGNTADTNSVAITIGASDSSVNFANVDIAEILVFPTALSTANRQRVERYLGLKYNIPVGYDPDAADYFSRITAAGSSITTANQLAVNDFIVGCKADGIWNAIKASCLLAGPNDLTGALVPLVGTAPTNFNFVSGDYNRTTGLLGDGTSKYLDSNRNNNADPQDSKHLAVWRTQSETLDITRAALGMPSVGGQSNLVTTSTVRVYRIHDTGGSVPDTTTITGLWGISRTTSSTKTGRYNNTNLVLSTVSATPASASLQVFARGGADFSNARMSFYSIGESIDLALLDARLTTYMASLT